MFEQAFRNIDDVLWKEAGCTTEVDYTEQTSWLLFLKYPDDLEAAGFGLDHLTEMQRLIEAEKSDLFDVLAYMAYATPSAARIERAARARPKYRQAIRGSAESIPGFCAGALRNRGRGGTAPGEAHAPAATHVSQLHHRCR